MRFCTLGLVWFGLQGNGSNDESYLKFMAATATFCLVLFGTKAWKKSYLFIYNLDKFKTKCKSSFIAFKREYVQPTNCTCNFPELLSKQLPFSRWHCKWQN